MLDRASPPARLWEGHIHSDQVAVELPAVDAYTGDVGVALRRQYSFQTLHPGLAPGEGYDIAQCIADAVGRVVPAAFINPLNSPRRQHPANPVASSSPDPSGK